MTNTSMMEEDKFGGILFQSRKKDKRVETEKSIEMRKDEKNEEKKL